MTFREVSQPVEGPEKRTSVSAWKGESRMDFRNWVASAHCFILSAM